MGNLNNNLLYLWDMIKGIGCDIVCIARIAWLMKSFGKKFLSRVFTTREIEAAPYIHQAAYFAKRFAAKEAYAKAIGLGIGKLAMRDIEVLNSDNGAPYIVSICDYKVHISLADERQFAIAYVILEYTASK